MKSSLSAIQNISRMRRESVFQEEQYAKTAITTGAVEPLRLSSAGVTGIHLGFRPSDLGPGGEPLVKSTRSLAAPSTTRHLNPGT